MSNSGLLLNAVALLYKHRENKRKDLKEFVMDKNLKILLAVLLVIYVLSPVDLFPGPVDDLVAVVLYALGSKALPRSDN